MSDTPLAERFVWQDNVASEETQAQRGRGTCPGLQAEALTELGFPPVCQTPDGEIHSSKSVRGRRGLLFPFLQDFQGATLLFPQTARLLQPRHMAAHWSIGQGSS